MKPAQIPESPLVTAKTVAAMLGVNEQTLAKWRCTGVAHPKFVRIGPRCIRFRLADVEAWLAARTVTERADTAV